MKETSFIEQNKEKWHRFEKLYADKSNDPEELSDLYMDITDDLSYAQTFYKRRTVRVYLNQLAQKVFTGVHKQKGDSFRRFLTVWTTSLPLEIYRSRKNLLFALVMFLIYATIGAVTTHMDPDFPRQVVGDGYVDMTLENIQNGNPLAVYEYDFFGNKRDSLESFISITTNNLKVAFLTFFVGFFFTIGTHMLLFYNGVMLGAFQYFFHAKGLLITSFLGIWIHGAFEISAIVLAGGAGITAGSGLLFPGSYTRLQSLQLSTKRGLKIMLSLVPFIIAAGFLEGYVTMNYQDFPNWSKWMLIMLCFAIILFFYVFYPMYVARKNPHLLDKEEVASFRIPKQLEFFKIRTIGEVISDSFHLYRILFAKFLPIITTIVFPLAVGLILWQDINHYNLQYTEYWYDWATQLSFMMGYCFINWQDLVVFFSWTILISIIFSAVFWSVRTKDELFSWRSFFKYYARRGVLIWVANLLLAGMVLALPWYLLLPGLFLIPVFYLQAASVGLGDYSFGKNWGKGFKYSGGHYWKTIVIILILVVIVFLIVQPIAFFFSIHFDYTNEPLIRDVLDMVADFTKRVAQVFTDDYMIWANGVRQLVYLVFVLAILPLVALTMALGYYSSAEKLEVKGLRKQFDLFGKRSRTQETKADYE